MTIRFAPFALTLSLLLSALGCAADPGTGTSSSAARVDCSLVRCAEPLCAEGQRLTYPRGSCCGVCVDMPSSCATVLCAAVECAEGEERVFRGNDCCGRCQASRPVRECGTDLDCPQYQCIACPCPVSECRGNRCVTWTPDASSCGSAI